MNTYSPFFINSQNNLLRKQAEAEEESKKLQGQGIANQRKVITEGLRESVSNLKEAIGTTVGVFKQMIQDKIMEYHEHYHAKNKPRKH